jgi:hypothetical protein
LQVAIKVLSSGADLANFAHEISILGRTHHPNVVSLLGASLSLPNVALIEELCDGSLERCMGLCGVVCNGVFVLDCCELAAKTRSTRTARMHAH